jgi:sec-independent protein translocase protein TatA
MGMGSIWHWLLLGLVAILLLGGGRFSNMMGDVAKGIKQFKKGMTEDQAQQPLEPNAEKDLQPMKDDRPHS